MKVEVTFDIVLNGWHQTGGNKWSVCWRQVAGSDILGTISSLLIVQDEVEFLHNLLLQLLSKAVGTVAGAADVAITNLENSLEKPYQTINL